jgi:hypothetical protein
VKNYKRGFLNAGYGPAMYERWIRDRSELGGGLSSTLSLSDCNRTIELDFFADSMEDAEAKLKKVQLLRDQLDAIEDALIEFYMGAPTRAERRAEDKEKLGD